MERSFLLSFARQLSLWKNIARELPCDDVGKGIYQTANIKFAIFDERGEAHSRPHFHAFVNHTKVASIFLDNFEIDYFNNNVKCTDKQKIAAWVKKNKEALQAICQKQNGEFVFPLEFYD